MGRITVLGGTLAGLAAAARLARLGHAVTLVAAPGDQPDPACDQLAGPVAFPAPWRDFFTKTGRPAAGALGVHGLTLAPAGDGWPTDRGAQWHHLSERFGEPVAARWRDLLDRHDATWQALRFLGLEAELTPGRLRAARLDPRRTVEDEARAFADAPPLAGRLRDVARAVGSEPTDAPAWLVSRLSVERTFGRWVLLDRDGRAAPSATLLDLVAERAARVGVRVTAGPPPEPGTVTAPGSTGSAGSADATAPRTAADADAIIEARPTGASWRRPRPFRPDFVAQLAARPPLRDPHDATRFHASPSSPGGAEPWAQLLTGALASYACHEALTGEDVRPTNRDLTRH